MNKVRRNLVRSHTTGSTSLWHELKTKTEKPQTAFNNCLLYLCRSINCQQFLRQSKTVGFDATDWRLTFLLQWKYYVTLRLYTFNQLAAKPKKTEFQVSKADLNAVRRALGNPIIRQQLVDRFKIQNRVAYTEQEVAEHISIALPALKKAAAMIVRSKLNFLRLFNGLLFEDLEQDLLVHAVQNLGWSYDRRPPHESVLLGCKIMHNKAKNMASFHSAKKRSCASPRDSQGFSSIIIVHDTDKAADTVAKIPNDADSQYVEDHRCDLERVVKVLRKNKKRRRLLRILIADENPKFEIWLKKRKVLRGKQTDRHLFMKSPRDFFLLAANYVGFSQKRTQRLLFSLSGEIV